MLHLRIERDIKKILGDGFAALRCVREWEEYFRDTPKQEQEIEYRIIIRERAAVGSLSIAAPLCRGSIGEEKNH